jgi:hypothetical protein
MNCKKKIRFPFSMAHRTLSIAILAVSALVYAQQPARFVGSITSIDNSTLTVKTDAGDLHKVTVPASATLRRISPGQKDLSSAVTLHFSDLATGDRVLVKLDPAVTGDIAQATEVIVVKLSDVALKQQKEREDWQQRGLGGLVKSIDPASGVIVLKSGSGDTAKTITVHTTKATVLKRYATASVSYDAAQVAPLDAILAGDQLRARGTKNNDGTEITAEEIVSGSFRNISATIVSIDTAGSTLVVKDLATKKQVTVHVRADAQMHRLPDRMAQMLAARLKGISGGSGNAPATAPGSSQVGGADPQQILSRAPAIQLADLTKGEPVMLVSTPGTSEVTAITLLAGVQALLESSEEATQNLLSSWSMDTSAGSSTASQ